MKPPSQARFFMHVSGRCPFFERIASAGFNRNYPVFR
jgi:hypothetical protein